MITFELDGEVVNIPSTPKEVTAGQYEEFKYLFRKYLNSEAEYTASTMLACLVPIFGDWVKKLDYTDPNEGLSEEGILPTAKWLFEYFQEVCLYSDKGLTYKDLENFEVEIEGEKYYLLGNSCRSLMFPQGQNLNVQEAVESELAAKTFKELNEAEAYRECDLAFTFDTSIAAIMLRKQGEMLPFEPSEFNVFFEQRKAFFAKHLSLDAAKKLVFFLVEKQQQYTEMMSSALTQSVTEALTKPNREQRRKQDKQSKKGKLGKIIPLNTQAGKVHMSKA